MTFELNGKEYIELNKLLKTLNLVESGGVAKMVIQDGEVVVNNEIELRVRRKLRVGDEVEFNEEKVVIKKLFFASNITQSTNLPLLFQH